MKNLKEEPPPQQKSINSVERRGGGKVLQRKAISGNNRRFQDGRIEKGGGKENLQVEKGGVAILSRKKFRLDRIVERRGGEKREKETRPGACMTGVRKGGIVGEWVEENRGGLESLRWPTREGSSRKRGGGRGRRSGTSTKKGKKKERSTYGRPALR